VVQAGTATSVRLREEEQSFNVLEASVDEVTVGLRRWAGTRFETAEPTRFRRSEGGWAQAKVLSDPAEA
jgi:hypothetical protein